jgi:hypothetical protein
VKGDHLTLATIYGGCGSHELRLCYPELTSQVIPRVRLGVIFNNKDATCEAAFWRHHDFDLEPLKRRYLQQFQTPTTPIVLEMPGLGEVTYAF